VVVQLVPALRRLRGSAAGGLAPQPPPVRGFGAAARRSL